ncbi:MAG TPA: histidine phosphatase family protein [Sphingomonas sp.]|nr:histidine phosphatase family protein [Sphingomonas sp.]
MIRGLVAHYLGLSADRLFRFDVDPGSVTTLSLHPGGGRVVALNERLS